MKIIKKSITGLILGLFLSFSVLLINKVETKADTITDLTGYTWVGNETLNGFLNECYINFLANDEPFNSINFDGITLAYDNENGDVPLSYVYTYTWKDESYRTIYITGGEDATDSTLISWLQANGTLSAPAPATYTITFNANGGTGTPPSSVQVNAGYDYELPGNTTNLTKENYHFLGWNTNPNASWMLYDLVNVQQDTTVYAIWIIDKYTITFNSNNGAGTPPASVEVNSGSDYTIPGNTTNLTKPHHHFIGWNTNQYAISGLATLSNIQVNTTLYAIWEIDQYTITFNANGGTGTPPASTTLDYGTTYNIGGNSTNLARPGYIFVGWNTNQNASNGLSHITVQANTTLYAIWRVDRDDQFNIYLNDNLIAQYNIDPINDSAHWYIGFNGFDIELFEINVNGGELDPLYQSSSYVLSNTISNIVFTFSGQYIDTIIIDLNGTTEEDWTYDDLVDNGSNYVHFWNGGDVDIYIYTRQTVNPDTDSLISTFKLLFRGVNEVMNIRFGWITIGGVLAIILSIGVVFFIFKLIRGGL